MLLRAWGSSLVGCPVVPSSNSILSAASAATAPLRALPAMGEGDPTARGIEGTVIGVTITATHDERIRANKPGELRDTGVAPPAPLTVSRRFLAEVFWSAVGVGVTLARRTP